MVKEREISHGGVSMVLSRWCQRDDVTVTTTAINRRLRAGWSVSEALFKPKSNTGRGKRKNIQKGYYNGKLYSVSGLVKMSGRSHYLVRKLISEGKDIATPITKWERTAETNRRAKDPVYEVDNIETKTPEQITLENMLATLPEDEVRRRLEATVCAA